MKRNLVRTRCMVHMCFLLAMCAAHRAAAEDIEWTLASGLFLDANFRKASVDLGFVESTSVTGIVPDIGWRGEIEGYSVEAGVRYPFALATLADPVILPHVEVERTIVSEDGTFSVTPSVTLSAAMPLRRSEAFRHEVQFAFTSEVQITDDITMIQNTRAAMAPGTRSAHTILSLEVELAEGVQFTSQASVDLREQELRRDQVREVNGEIATHLSLSF